MSRKYCETCDNKGYLFETRDDFAAARACPDCAARCPDCHDEGTITRLDSRGYEFLETCPCQHLHERIRRFNAAAIPARYSHCQLITYEPLGGNQGAIFKRVTKHLDAARPHGRGLLISGAVGTGKTHLLVSILRELTLERAIHCRFVEFTHLLSDIKEGFNQGRNEAEVLGPVSRIPVLGVDELGKGLATDWQLSILDEIISRRYNRHLTTYFTTNLPIGEATPDLEQPVTAQSGNLRRSLEMVQLVDRIGERIFSRLHEMCEIVEVKGPDYRRSKLS